MAKKQTLADPDFGILEHEIGDLWTSTVIISHFGKTRQVAVNVLFDKSLGIEIAQRQAWRLMQEDIGTTMTTAEREIANLALLEGVEESMVADAVKPIAINFPAAQNSPTFGILYDVTWEPEHGAAVKFVNGQFAEVGLQDIVL